MSWGGEDAEAARPRKLAFSAYGCRHRYLGASLRPEAAAFDHGGPSILGAFVHLHARHCSNYRHIQRAIESGRHYLRHYLEIAAAFPIARILRSHFAHFAPIFLDAGRPAGMKRSLVGRAEGPATTAKHASCGLTSSPAPHSHPWAPGSWRRGQTRLRLADDLNGTPEFDSTGRLYEEGSSIR